jgi:hypothetical protein
MKIYSTQDNISLFRGRDAALWLKEILVLLVEEHFYKSSESSHPDQLDTLGVWTITSKPMSSFRSEMNAHTMTAAALWIKPMLMPWQSSRSMSQANAHDMAEEQL